MVLLFLDNSFKTSYYKEERRYMSYNCEDEDEDLPGFSNLGKTKKKNKKWFLFDKLFKKKNN